MLRPCKVCPSEHFTSIWHVAPTNPPLESEQCGSAYIYIYVSFSFVSTEQHSSHEVMLSAYHYSK